MAAAIEPSAGALAEASDHWAIVAGALLADREAFVARLSGAPPTGTSDAQSSIPFGSDPAIAHSLTLVCHHGFHGLLVQWAFGEASARLKTVAVPRFWAAYDRLLESEPDARPAGRAAAQRRCVCALMEAVSELRAVAESELSILRVLEAREWPGGSNAGASSVSAFPARPEPPGHIRVGLGMEISEELLSLLQTLTASAEPNPGALEDWMAHCWRRLFVDATRGAGGLAADGPVGGAWVGAEWGEDGDGGTSGERMENESEEGSGEESPWDGESEEGEEEGEEHDEPMDTGDDLLSARSGASGAWAQLAALSRHLHALGWVAWVHASVSRTLHETLRHTLRRKCAGHFETRMLGRVLGWLDRRVLPWLSLVLEPEGLAPGASPSTTLRQWRARLRFFIMQALAETRIGELFDIVVDFPESAAALDDLRACLQRTQQHGDAVNGLGEALEARLLKPGADTSNVIQVYICTIRALRRLDPSGLSLEAISERVRAYLKMRPDTVRQVVTSLTDPESSDLLDPGEAHADQVVQEEEAHDEMAIDPDEMRGDEAAMLNWEPHPQQAEAHMGSASLAVSSARRSADVLAILVNIYGSKTLFVNEFRSMLADKLLSSAGADTEKEVRNLEMLKKRFGDSALSACEVMLTDVAESRRVSRSIRSHLGASAADGGGASAADGGGAPIDATIVSRLCWPHLSQETFELPAGVKKEMTRFEKQFAHIKAPRKLVWKPSLGLVTLDVKFADTTVTDVQCTPLQATILLRFGAQSKWTLSELSDSLGISAESAKKKMSLWLNRGFITEAARTPDAEPTYAAATSLGASDESHAAADDEDVGDTAASLAAEQLAQEMRVYEQYVIGMLTNLESLPLLRIHNMLKMFVPATGGERGYDRNEQELQRFLHLLVDDGKLEHSAGQYRLHRG